MFSLSVSHSVSVSLFVRLKKNSQGGENEFQRLSVQRRCGKRWEVMYMTKSPPSHWYVQSGRQGVKHFNQLKMYAAYTVHFCNQYLSLLPWCSKLHPTVTSRRNKHYTWWFLAHGKDCKDNNYGFLDTYTPLHKQHKHTCLCLHVNSHW